MGIKKGFLLAVFFTMVTSILIVFVTELDADQGGGIWCRHGECWVGSGTPSGTSWRRYSCSWCHEEPKGESMDKELFQLHQTKHFRKHMVKLREGQEVQFANAFVKWEKYRYHVLDKNHKFYQTMPSGSYVVRTPNGAMGLIFPLNAQVDSKNIISVFQGVVK